MLYILNCIQVLRMPNAGQNLLFYIFLSEKCKKLRKSKKNEANEAKNMFLGLVPKLWSEDILTARVKRKYNNLVCLQTTFRHSKGPAHPNFYYIIT